MEPRRAVRIWVRTYQGATRPSLDVQSVPRFIADSVHENARKPLSGKIYRKQCLTTWEVPLKG